MIGLDGRLTKEILSDGSYWEIAYNDRERTISRTLKNSSHTTLSQERFVFDRRGNVISYTDGKNNTVTRQYDGLNRLKTEINPSDTPQAAQEQTHISYGRNTLMIINNLEEKQIFTKDAWGRINSVVNENANNQKVAETTYAYSPNNITETNGTVSTTTTFDPLGNPVLVNRFDSDEGFAKQVLDIGVAHVSTIGIPVSMYLGFAGQAAEWWGLTNVASKLNTASGSILEFVADRWTAGNQGPMGRVVDKQIYAVTTTTFLKNVVIPLLRLGKQETAINDAKLTIPMIGVSMGLGGIGTAAKKLGLKSVGNTFDEWSVSLLQNVADRLSATNEGPMGRVFDMLTRSTTGYARPFLGHNQQFLVDWTTGDLPTRIVYAPDSIQVRDMAASPNVKRTIDEFYAKGAPKIHPFRHDTFDAFWETIANRSTRNLKSTAMQVGGYVGTITNSGNGTMTIRIENTAGARSFFYHLLPNLPGKSGPMHNVEQVFEWTIPIDPTRLPQPTNK